MPISGNQKAAEKFLWGWLNSKAKPAFKHDLHINRVENEVSKGGMPDVEGCLEGNSFWIELKTAKRPVKTTTPIRVQFQPRQVPWLERRTRAGGNAFVLLQVGSGFNAKRYLIPGDRCRVVENGVPEYEINALSVIEPTANAAAVVRAAATF